MLTQQLSLAEDAAVREREAAVSQLATTERALAHTAGEKHAAARREVKVSNSQTAASGQLERERERDGAVAFRGLLALFFWRRPAFFPSDPTLRALALVCAASLRPFVENQKPES